jgi:hypothetical protein
MVITWSGSFLCLCVSAEAAAAVHASMTTVKIEMLVRFMLNSPLVRTSQVLFKQAAYRAALSRTAP